MGCLSCRTEKDAPFPYMLFFLGAERLILQVHLPLCALDEDLDGTEVHMPQRSFSTGTGPDLQTSTCLVLSLNGPPIPRELAASGSSCEGMSGEKHEQLCLPAARPVGRQGSDRRNRWHLTYQLAPRSSRTVNPGRGRPG